MRIFLLIMRIWFSKQIINKLNIQIIIQNDNKNAKIAVFYHFYAIINFIINKNQVGTVTAIYVSSFYY
jgi:hypothetical protein